MKISCDFLFNTSSMVLVAIIWLWSATAFADWELLSEEQKQYFYEVSGRDDLDVDALSPGLRWEGHLFVYHEGYFEASEFLVNMIDQVAADGTEVSYSLVSPNLVIKGVPDVNRAFVEGPLSAGYVHPDWVALAEQPTQHCWTWRRQDGEMINWAIVLYDGAYSIEQVIQCVGSLFLLSIGFENFDAEKDWLTFFHAIPTNGRDQPLLTPLGLEMVRLKLGHMRSE